MSELREKIQAEVELAMQRAILLEQGGVFTGEEAEGHTDRILALIAEAMLSDEAVDAHLTRTWGWYDYDKGLWYDDAPEDVKEGARDDARHGVEGALAAAGVTDAGQEGASNE